MVWAWEENKYPLSQHKWYNLVGRVALLVTLLKGDSIVGGNHNHASCNAKIGDDLRTVHMLNLQIRTEMPNF